MPDIARKMYRNLPKTLENINSIDVLPEQRLQASIGEEMMVLAGGAGLSVGVDEAGLMACSLEPNALSDILDCMLEIGMAQLNLIARSGIKVVLGGGDMADKNGTMYSPLVFRDLVLPRLKKLINRAKELNLHYVWRTDGNTWKVCDMIFNEAGVPGYGEVDYDASMTTGELRKQYPDVVIWANVSGDLLHQSTEQQVYENSMKLLQDSNGSHYFHGCSNTILSGTPIENVLAMMKARDDYTIACQ